MATVQSPQQASGGNLSGEAFRLASISVGQALSFNLGIEETNKQRQLKSVSRKFQRTIGQQISQQAASGISITSKSSMQLRNETMDVFGTSMLNLKLDHENVKRGRIFEAQIQQTNLENQARAAEFRQRADKINQTNQGNLNAFESSLSGGGGAGGAVSSIIGGLF